MKIKSDSYLLAAHGLGAIVINKSDIVEKIGHNLKVKKSIFDEYFEDTEIALYVRGTKTINIYAPVYHYEDSILLLYIGKVDCDYYSDNEHCC